MTDNKDDEMIRRGDALALIRKFSADDYDLADISDAIAALPAVTPQPAPDVGALVEALRKCVAMLDALVKESGRGVDWGEEDPFRMGEWFEDQDLANIEAARAALAAWEGRGNE
jgi:hypothetical protein